jgi:protein SCO1/2
MISNKYFLAILLLLSCFSLSTADNTLPPMLKDVGIDQRVNTQLPLNLTFKDESGKDVQLQQYFHTHKPVILTLVYYEFPMLCTEVLNGLLKSLKVINLDVGKDFDVVTVSFDPGETPKLASEKKAAYLRAYKRPGANSGWHFMTGQPDSIKELTKAVGFRYKYDPKSDQFAHGAAIMVITPQGKISNYFYGVEYSARDIRLALVEASEGRIGTIRDQILLFCFHYDPSTGKYSTYALNLVRLGGILTVIGLGIFIYTNRGTRVKDNKTAKITKVDEEKQ